MEIDWKEQQNSDERHKQKLKIQKCKETSQLQHPPTSICKLFEMDLNHGHSLKLATFSWGGLALLVETNPGWKQTGENYKNVFQLAYL